MAPCHSGRRDAVGDMPKPGSTAARGYDKAHERGRRQALANLTDGDPCARCGQPMYRDQALDYDHTDDRTGYLGLSHASPCNRGAGGRASAAARRRRKALQANLPVW